MIFPRKNPFIKFFLKKYILRLLRKFFYSIHIRHKENFSKIKNDFPVILYANHSNWWDGFVAFFISSCLLDTDDYLMMDLEQLHKYRFFKYIGVFSVNRKKPADAYKTIKFSAELLKNSTRYLWIFPQGDMKPQDTRPLNFYKGISKLAEITGRVNIIPVALRYEFLNEQRPEVFIEIGKPFFYDDIISEDLTASFEKKLVEMLDKLRDDIAYGKLDSFSTEFRGKNSRNKTIDSLYR